MATTARYTYKLHDRTDDTVTYKIIDTTGQEADRTYTAPATRAPYLGTFNLEYTVSSECDRLNKLNIQN